MIAVEIKNCTKGAHPRVPFDMVKNAILGKDYELSIAFIGSRRSKKLNHIYRNKNKPTNILSFSLSKKSGEVFIDLGICKKQHKKFNKTYYDFVGFLVIHGLLHLKGYEHSSTMEDEERQYCAKFGF